MKSFSDSSLTRYTSLHDLSLPVQKVVKLPISIVHEERKNYPMKERKKKKLKVEEPPIYAASDKWET